MQTKTFGFEIEKSGDGMSVGCFVDCVLEICTKGRDGAYERRIMICIAKFNKSESRPNQTLNSNDASPHHQPNQNGTVNLKSNSCDVIIII